MAYIGIIAIIWVTENTPAFYLGGTMQNREYQRLFQLLLSKKYQDYPWRVDGEVLPLDIVLDMRGGFPIWWHQVATTAKLLGISESDLPAKNIPNEEGLFGMETIWPEENHPIHRNPAYRMLFPAIGMDAIVVLHRQEDLALSEEHLSMFYDSDSVFYQITHHVPVEMLIEPLPFAQGMQPEFSESASMEENNDSPNSQE